jgi:hypothetical protein
MIVHIARVAVLLWCVAEFEDVLIGLFVGGVLLLIVGAIAWGIKEHYRIKRSLTGMAIFPSVVAPHAPHDDRIDYAERFIEHIAPKIAMRNGVFCPSEERASHILSIMLHPRRGSVEGRHAFIISASITLHDRTTNTTLVHGNVSVDDRQELRHAPPVRNRDGRVISAGHRYLADSEQWGTTPEGRVRGLGMLADKVLQFIDSNRAVRLLVERAKNAEAAMRKAESDLAARANQPN